MKQIPGVIGLGGEERNFNYCYSRNIPQTHTLSRGLLGPLELLRQSRLKVF